MASAIRRYADDRLAWAHTDIFAAGLDPFSGWVYTYLAARADRDGKTWPKQETIAADCGVSERQVRNCIDRLIEKRLLVVIQKAGGGRKSIYYLPSRNQWVADQVAGMKQPAPPAGCSTENEGGNRHLLPVQPAPPAGCLTKELNPMNLIQNSSFVVPSKLPKGKKKQADPLAFLTMFAPDEFRHDDSFVESWKSWAESRAGIAPLTEQAAKMAIKKLTAYPIPHAVKALDHATLSGWRGVFPESLGKSGKSDKFDAASSDQPKNDWF